MYVTELPGLRVLSVLSALRMGTVESALIDPSCRFVAALRVREYGPSGRRLIPREMVKRVGQHAVIIARDIVGQEDVEHAERLIPLRELIGLEVVSDRGDLLGFVRDIEMDRDTLNLERVEIARTRAERALRLRPPLRVDAQLVICGSRDAMLLPESALERAHADEVDAMEPDEADQLQPTRPYPRSARDVGGDMRPDMVRWTPPDVPQLDGDQDQNGAALG